MLHPSPSSQKTQKVLSVTLNTAIDHIIEVDHLAVGDTIRSLGDTIVPAGKGVDVAVGVATLGGRAVATGFVGAESRDVFSRLKDENVELLLLEVPGKTRTNVTILERNGCRETHLQTTGYSISAADIKRLVDVLDRTLVGGDVAVIAGSIPPGAPAGVIAQLIAQCRDKGAYVILDGSGRSLTEGLNARPHMIKPNLLELSQVAACGVDESDAGVILAADQCLERGLERVVVSCGQRGIIVVERGRAWKALVDVGRNQTTASVGSGDAVVAAFALGTIEGRSIEDTNRLAVACAAANLFTDLPGRFRVADVNNLLPKITVQELRVPAARSKSAAS